MFNAIGLKKKGKVLTNIFGFLNIPSIGYRVSGTLFNVETISSRSGEIFCISDYTKWRNLFVARSVDSSWKVGTFFMKMG